MIGKSLGLSWVRTGSTWFSVLRLHLPRLSHFLGYLASPSLFRWPGHFLVALVPPSGTNVRRLLGQPDLSRSDSSQRGLGGSVSRHQWQPWLLLRFASLCQEQSPPPWQIVLGGVRVLGSSERGGTRSCSQGTRNRQGEEDRDLSFCYSVRIQLKTPSLLRIPPPAVAVVRPREQPFWMFGSCCHCCRRPRSCWFHSRFRAGECHSRL